MILFVFWFRLQFVIGVISVSNVISMEIKVVKEDIVKVMGAFIIIGNIWNRQCLGRNLEIMIVMQKLECARAVRGKFFVQTSASLILVSICLYSFSAFTLTQH